MEAMVKTVAGTLHVVATSQGAGRIIKCLPREVEDEDYGNALDVVEALVLAHVCAGIDVESPAYITGLNTALEAIANNL